MHSSSAEQSWDFSHVRSLIDSLSHTADNHKNATDNGDTTRQQNGGKEATLSNHYVEEKDFASSTHDLGDFSKIYQYLGVPLNASAPAVQPSQGNGIAAEDAFEFPTKDDYASDGATYVKRSPAGSKSVQWDASLSTEEGNTGDVSDTSVVPDSPTLTKSQRKKRNRRERKAKEAAAAAKAATVSESEADIVTRTKTPALKASTHVRAGTPNNKYIFRPRDESGRVATSSSAGVGNLNDSIATAVQRVQAAKASNLAQTGAESDVTPSKPPRPNGNLARTASHPPTLAQNTGPSAPIHQQSSTTKAPVTPSQNKETTRFLPSTVQPPSNFTKNAVPAPVQGPAPPQTAPRSNVRRIEPLTVRSGEDRHYALFFEILRKFYEDKKYLVNPMNLTTHNNNPEGIHVFVDASNIFLGFKDQLKQSRGIPAWHHVPDADMSFDALALLMERRRPVSKRVLVGSNPWLAAFDKAKAVGYECSVLEKVYKARQLTERQIFFRDQDRAMGRGRAKAPPANNVATLNGAASGSGSGSETNAPQYAPPAMIEQGVDEILHLKMMESLVDTAEPATMVLATGDAARAEYSEGFMAMAERVLKKGWTVELVSWSKNISQMYRRKEWTSAWGDRFKIVYLDDFAELLLDM